MEYLVGVVLAVAVSVHARMVGFDRERGFYPIILMVIAALYILFAVSASATGALGMEALLALPFFILATLGFKKTLWFVVLGLTLHGCLDFVHPKLVANGGVPVWWPNFCLAYDVAAAAVLALIIRARRLTT